MSPGCVDARSTSAAHEAVVRAAITPRPRRPRGVPRGRRALSRAATPRASRRRPSEADGRRAAARRLPRVLPIGAQSSLTGGATPMGEVAPQHGAAEPRSSTSATDWVRVEAGVTLVDLDAALAAAGKLLPAGADLHRRVRRRHRRHQRGRRGDVQVRHDARLGAGADRRAGQRRRAGHRARRRSRAHRRRLLRDRACRTGPRACRCRATGCRDVPKLSAGYFAAPGMDLIDLFIGSEGTLGVITEVTLRVLPARPALCLAFVPFDDRAAALAFVAAAARRGARDLAHRRPARHRRVRDRAHGRALPGAAARGRRRSRGRRRDSRRTRRWRCSSRSSCRPARRRRRRSTRSAARARPDAPDTPLVRFCRALDAAGVLDDVEIAVPGDRARAAQLLALREAVPAGGQRARRAREADDRRAHREDRRRHDRAVRSPRRAARRSTTTEFARRGLDAAVWGHISDGNLHPNVIPRSMADVESGKAAILRVRPRGDPAGRLAARRARRRAEPGQAAAAASSCTARRDRARCARSSARWIRSGSSRRVCCFRTTMTTMAHARRRSDARHAETPAPGRETAPISQTAERDAIARRPSAPASPPTRAPDGGSSDALPRCDCATNDAASAPSSSSQPAERDACAGRPPSRRAEKQQRPEPAGDRDAGQQPQPADLAIAA